MTILYFQSFTCDTVGMPSDESIPEPHLPLCVVLVHSNGGYEEGGARHCAVEDLVGEQAVLAGEEEALDNAASEILESFGGEASMESFITAVQSVKQNIDNDEVKISLQNNSFDPC